MLPHRTISTARHRALKFLVALLVLGGWSLSSAGPVAEPSVLQRQPTPTRYASVRAAVLNMALPAPASAKWPAPSVRLDEPRPVRVNSPDPSPATSPGADIERRTERSPAAGFDIRWRESREIVSPDLVSMIRNYRRDGLPVVQLYQSGHNVVAIGLNPHGLPGIYFTRHIGG